MECEFIFPFLPRRYLKSYKLKDITVNLKVSLSSLNSNSVRNSRKVLEMNMGMSTTNNQIKKCVDNVRNIEGCERVTVSTRHYTDPIILMLIET